jgi:glycosyltransferase involved in cell wall biosynthesis
LSVAIVHDYLTQRGGAERVVRALADAFPSAPIYTSLYDASGTFPEFEGHDIRTLWMNRFAPIRSRHRLAFPLLAQAFSSLEVDADVVLCSSSGWAHGARTVGRKIVYCHSPAKWLYRPDDYLGARSRYLTRSALVAARPLLLRWDRRAAATADLYLANSTFVSAQIRDAYCIDAEVVHPPVVLDTEGAQEAVPGVEPGFFLAVSRLLPYKNVAAIVAAFRELPSERLVVVGEGAQADALRAEATANVMLLGTVGDAQLRWLYATCGGLVSASREDLGLTPLEAASFGKPAAVLRWGGFLDTVVDGETGVFFEHPTATDIAAAVRTLVERDWNASGIEAHAARFSQCAFAEQLRALVAGV